MNPSAPNPSLSPATSVDLAIQVVEGLYQSITGHPPPPGNGHHAPMPPEVDPAVHVERQLERLLGELQGQASVANARWSPPVQAWEADDALVIALDVPGTPRDAIDVSVGNGALIVTGERRPRWQATTRVLAAEQPLGRFRRVLPLPPGARPDQLAATLRDGVLEVRIAIASTQAEPKSVPVQ